MEKLAADISFKKLPLQGVRIIGLQGLIRYHVLFSEKKNKN